MNEARKRSVVLGANGFIGSALTRALLEAGHDVLACDLTRDFYALKDVVGVRCQTLDFLDEAAVRSVVEEATHVFHLVSTTKPAASNVNMAYDVQSNVVASIHLFEACVAAGVQKVVFASSGGTVYGVPRYLPIDEQHPTCPIVSYGVTKLTIEHYARIFRQQRGLPVVSLRIGNPYGPRHYDMQQGVIPVFMRKVLNGEPLEIWGDGKVVRDYIYVDDVARAFLAAAEYGGPCEVFNIGSGEGLSLLDIVAFLEGVCKESLQPRFQPARGFDVPHIVLDVTRARADLGWEPSWPFLEGLGATWASFSA